MTIGDLVKETVDALPAQEQRKALALVRKLRPRAIKSTRKINKPAAKRQARAVEVDAAILEAAGIWKSRTDLPKNSVAASRSLRRHLMRRGGNA